VGIAVPVIEAKGPEHDTEHVRIVNVCPFAGANLGFVLSARFELDSVAVPVTEILSKTVTEVMAACTPPLPEYPSERSSGPASEAFSTTPVPELNTELVTIPAPSNTPPLSATSELVVVSVLPMAMVVEPASC
jgi:hypothetical protein